MPPHFKMLFNAIILKGRSEARINNRPEFDRFIASLAHSEKDVRLTFEVKKAKSKRSDQQNRFYWPVVVGSVHARLVELGNDISKEDVHHFLRGKFCYTELYNELTGEVDRLPKSTTTLTKMEFADYISSIQQWASEVLQIYIGDPNEQLTIDTE